MSDVLGPCPVCGGTESEMRMVEWTELRKCTKRECQHVCRVEHWNLLRRKMTREEIHSQWMRSHRSECHAVRFGMDCTCDAPSNTDVMLAALTGEKT